MSVRQTRQLIVMRHLVEPLLILDELLFGLAPDRHIVRDVGKAFAAVRLESVAADFDIDLQGVLALELHIERGLASASSSR